MDPKKKCPTIEIGWSQSDASGVALPAVNPEQVVHAGSRLLKHPATAESSFMFVAHGSITSSLFPSTHTLIYCFPADLPEEQHDGKCPVWRAGERHRQLDGLLQVLLGDVEAVIVDTAAQEGVLLQRSLLLHRCDHMLLI